ncbi:heavy metal translocating P-type ATPase [Neolewinella litorea]|uniref:Cation-translocating P-type ATPase n=1 Tax=Neolewinella litorea TaxID=2562452 RepID=A0A4S4NZ35_9BACT|nr:cation-translocating P-type ATPase [Neolewinella litorea]THH41550.1 cation-translocating P-type ATPase [Neolewinella litorea]
MTKRSDIIELRVEGMDCNNCAMSISRFLERKGLQDVMVNFQTREVRYRRDDGALDAGAVKAGIEKLGYTVVDDNDETTTGLSSGLTARQRLVICAALTLPLLLNHFLMMAGVHSPLDNGWIQLALTAPVYWIGGLYFGRSALSGLRARMLNMDVLIFLGATAAFIYSLIGLYWQNPQYYFFETAATIITLVLVGNWLEARAVEKTTTAIGALTALKEDRAQVLMPSGTLVSLPVDEVQPGAQVRVNTGDRIPLDGIVRQGQLTVNEAMLTGESLPVEKAVGDQVLGGSVVVSGQTTVEVTETYRDGTLARIIELVKTAQSDKPQLQRLADRISAVFVPVVIVISILTFLIGWGTGYASATQAFMNAVAVLLISCPCAMGLATPTAVMVGVGRLARTGLLIRGGSTVETFAGIRQMVFDKTGTLTTGELEVGDFRIAPNQNPAWIHRLIYDLEGYSSHPIAGAVREYLARQSMVEADDVDYQNWRGEFSVAETPGLGLSAGPFYLGAAKDESLDADVVLRKDNQVLASLTLIDTVRPGTAAMIRQLHDRGVKTVLLTGDRPSKAERVAEQVGIDEVFAGQLPDQKLERISRLSGEQPTAMVGDGINDAAALSRADLGISLGGASAVALDAAQVVLMRDDLSVLIEGKRIADLTVRTIKESLFWAFSYNIVAIPLAALGYLNPMWAALFMAFSDVVVIGNAIRLKRR